MVETRNYEFACHFTTKLDEATVPAKWSEVQALIAKNGGTITAEQQPAKQRLSYPILHQRQSYFGWVQFSTESDTLLPELNEWARLHPEVLRHITLKLEAESDKRAAKQAAHLERKAAKQVKEASQQKKTVTEKKADDTGKQDKELEDVLGNL
jgi:ribosomal protein S6